MAILNDLPKVPERALQLWSSVSSLRGKSQCGAHNPRCALLVRGRRGGLTCINPRENPRQGACSPPGAAADFVDGVYRSESRRVFATLIRLLGDFDLAEEALHDAFRAALEQWPRDGVPGQSAGVARVGRPLQGDRRHAPARAVRRARRRRRASREPRRRDRGVGRRGHRGRPAAADLHLLPSGAAAGRAGGADAARGVRPHDGRDRARVS